MTDDDATPTQSFPMVTPTGPVAVAPRRTSPLLVALIAVGGLVVLGTIVIVVLLLTGRAGQENASAPLPDETPSATPTVSGEPSQTPGPPPSDPQNAYFTVFAPGDRQVECIQDQPTEIAVQWDSKNAVSAQFLYNEPDAYHPVDIPVRGDALPGGISYPCTHDPMKFSIILTGKDGVKVTQSWVVENVGYVYPNF